ncbi:MAG TPA: glycosyltransferase [Solirubrobacteraceae bacterium]|nr:glycosyltransferase [Solirubrobacteraceae bacterium]
MRIAYLLDQYPAISHTFILREVVGLRDRGVEVDTFSIRSSNPQHLLAREDMDEYKRTFALLPISPSALVARHALAFARAPKPYFQGLLGALKIARGHPRRSLWQLFYFAEAVLVWHAMRKRGLRHVHAHFTSPAADVAMLVAALGGGASNGWTWSFSAHGSDIHETDQRLLAEKVRRASLVVCVSDFGRSQLLTLVDERHWSKVKVVRCGLERTPAQPRQVAADAQATPLNLLNVGRMVRLKGQSVLLEAVALLRQRGVAVHLTIVGDGPLWSDLHERVERLQLGTSVSFAGYVGQDEIGEFYAAADVFCLPSFREGLPVVLMEAMASGLPVIASGIMGIPELVEPGHSGLLVAPGRADLLADAVAALADDPAKRHQFGEHGRRRVLTEFDLADSVARLDGMLSEVASPGE